MLPGDSLPDGLPDDVVTRLEVLLRQSAWYTRVGFCFALWFVENATSFLFLEWGRFSRIDVQRARSRFKRLSHHRLDVLVLVAKLLKSLVQIAIYSDARVEQHFGNHRRAWRKNRAQYRNTLVQIDQARTTPVPPIPEPLADPKVVSPETYLAWQEEDEHHA